MAEQVLAGSGLSAANLGLRFDRVVVRVMGDLKAFALEAVPDGSAAIVTLSAPLRVPARTVEAVAALLASADLEGDWRGALHGNQVGLRRVRRAADTRPKLVGFVHNPSTDPVALLDLAERWLRP